MKNLCCSHIGPMKNFPSCLSFLKILYFKCCKIPFSLPQKRFKNLDSICLYKTWDVECPRILLVGVPVHLLGEGVPGAQQPVLPASLGQ